MIETAYEFVTRITLNDSDITENREMPVIEVCCNVLVEFSSEWLSEHGGFESCEIFD